MINPIKDNRIVNDMTFAIRLYNFIKQTNVCDAASEEEHEYLMRVAKRLFDYQKQTATQKGEIDYLKRIENDL